MKKAELIDWERISELRSDFGDDGFEEVVEIFLEEVGEAVESLGSVCADPEALEEVAHFLKGSALNLGFAKLSELCAAAERLAAQGGCIDGSEEISCAFRDSCAELQKGRAT